MLDIKAHINLISALRDKEDIHSLSYAALECRIALEAICIERIRLSSKYLSPRDIKGWRPKDAVISACTSLGDDISKGAKMSIGSLPLNSNEQVSIEDFQQVEYSNLGERADLKLQKLHRLWQRISGVALHSPVARIFDDSISIYGDKAEITKKINEVLSFLTDYSKGNIEFGHLSGKDYTFECLTCGHRITKSIASIKKAAVAYCPNRDCIESYLITRSDDNGELSFSSRAIAIKCSSCFYPTVIPRHLFERLTIEKDMNYSCEKCARDLIIRLVPVFFDKTKVNQKKTV